MSNKENEPIGNSQWIHEFDLWSLEDRVSCDGDKCSNDAKVYTKVTCCGSVLLMCEPCMVATARFVLPLAKRGLPIVCKACSELTSAQGWLSRPQKL